MQSATNTSTAADLLKQGAGSVQACLVWFIWLIMMQLSKKVSAVLAFDQQGLLVPHVFKAMTR